MEGRGVTNYSTSKPSHSYTTSTTQFDDELIKRGIVTVEQAMLAKGAAPEEALRLANLKLSSNDSTTSNSKSSKGANGTNGNHNEDDDENDADSDEEFLRNHRKKRIAQLQRSFGMVIPIDRTEWTRHVNDASSDGTWVVIHLAARNDVPSSSSSVSSSHRSHAHLDVCHLVERDVLPSLAAKFPHIKFVSIPSKSAIPNWPEENLPTLFCYRYGKLQSQMVGLQSFGCFSNQTNDGPDETQIRVPTVEMLEWRLSLFGVLETDLDEEPEWDDCHVEYDVQRAYGRSRFNGEMATLATGTRTGRGYHCHDDYNDDESDYDDVD